MHLCPCRPFVYLFLRHLLTFDDRSQAELEKVQNQFSETMQKQAALEAQAQALSLDNDNLAKEVGEERFLDVGGAYVCFEDWCSAPTGR